MTGGRTAAMALAGFHAAVARWFEGRFGAPTPPQRRGWEAIRSGGHTLIAAPTGSGKTLAAFLASLDDLFREGLDAPLPDEVRVVYVSPLKALSTDIHRNLAGPRREIRQVAETMGLEPPRITAAIRTGDTPQGERAAMLRTPPHILVTTPESLYLLLTAERSRAMLRTARAVIVDEIHAVLESRRGAHLALSLERLDHVAGRRLQRIGLSATQKPIDEVARFLVGAGDGAEDAGCAIVDEGHVRALDVGIEVTGSALEAVMSGEAWEEVHDRVAERVREHRTTLVFVNTRRMAERVARHLSERLGEDAVAAHHGSLSKEARLDAEDRLRAGTLKALVATASLELGIDIGAVDLVCQLGSPRRIATFLQRVGRSGHTVAGTPKGRLFPLSRDDLVEGAALLRSVRRGELDRAVLHEKPLDVLAQQVVAETAAEDWEEDALYGILRRAWPYRDLGREEFREVVQMVARGFTTRRGRQGALVHHDAVNRRLRGRRGARLTALTSGGAIPETADYRVVLEPEGTFVGTLNEDFAIESMAGDVFQLGNTSWRILRIGLGEVRVEDARGEPPNIPFWLGEAPARSAELSTAVAELRAELERVLEESEGEHEGAVEWAERELGLDRSAAEQLVAYLAESRRLLGVLPTQDTLVLERFFDEAGGMQLILHAPFGGRVNRAWGLALRKRFCRSFNFELQAAATEDGILLSLGPQHSFPLDDVFRYLHPATLRETLVQAVLDAPMFQTRWRWNGNLSLAIPRSRGGKRVPPQIQRMQAEDLLAAVFPDAAACLENVAGDREVPDHPLVRQALADCLTEAMDLPALEAVIRRIHAGELRLVARDVPEPSPLAHELLNARPYAFLDDAPLEERRAQAVYTRRALDPSSARDLGALDPEAIERVRGEAWPDPGDADELHDALLGCGFLTAEEAGRQPAWAALLEALSQAGRVTRLEVGAGAPAGEARGAILFAAAERVPELRALFPGAREDPPIELPPDAPVRRGWSREEALRELVRGRLEILGPVTVEDLVASVGDAAPPVPTDLEVQGALAALEAEGVILRGAFSPGMEATEWCDRRLLARIHRYTLNRLRAEIEPVSAANLMRFLFRWQRVEPGHRARGLEGLLAVVELLDGFELPAAAWEPDVLAARVEEYGPELLDTACLTGRVMWGRLSPPGPRNGGGQAGRLRTTPVALFLRASASLRLARSAPAAHVAPEGLSTHARLVHETLARRGDSFFHDLTSATGLLATQVESALGELVAAGLATADGFSGLRALLAPPDRRPPLSGARRRRRAGTPYGVDSAGRWSLLRAADSEDRAVPAPSPSNGARPGTADPAVEAHARSLLRRYGVVFRRLLAREPGAPPWRELVRALRRLEARGDIRGGRFVQGFAGEQFALPEAVGALRRVRKEGATGRLLAVSAADPLNLTGIVTPGERVAALAGNRVVYRDGVPVAVREGGRLRTLPGGEQEPDTAIRQALVRRWASPLLRSYLGSRG